MIDILNFVLALATIGFGVIGWLMPGYTMDIVQLKPVETTMGTSEVRAASGALFVGLGIAAILIGTPTAYAMLGAAWGGAAIGRVTSIVVDPHPTRRTYGFAGTEIAFALLLLGLNAL